nr:juvenile hormone esterase-like [Procambarus clarkii]
MRWLVVVLMMAGGALARSSPLEHLPGLQLGSDEDYWGNRKAVIKGLWDQYTVEAADPPIVTHPNLNGANFTTNVTGKTMMTINNRTIYAFQGIKYGMAPKSTLRFKKTVPAGVYWEGDTLAAHNIGSMCPQKAMLGKVAAGDEDCLFLNVYTPWLPNGTLLPVMFFIHGGAFVSGDSSLYLPTKLLDRDVILVVIHYRLGSFGFFSLDNVDAPGNAGLWDQIEAMKWVQDNIEGFGGDSSRVTIFGESAGSASVNYHLIIKESAGLFAGVIGESGSALEHWSHDPDPIGSAKLVGAHAGCPTDNLQTLYDCMRDMPADTLSLNMAHFVAEDRRGGGMGFKGAAPVTQGPDVPEPLITKDPYQSFIDNEVHDVPLLIGTNKHEGSFVLGIVYSENLEVNNYTHDNDYLRNKMIDDILNAFGVSDYTGGISESLVDAYIGDTDLADFQAAAPGLIDMCGVFFLKAGAWETAKYHARLNSSTFFYSFDFESDDTMFRWLFIGHAPMPFRPGVTHSDELMYLFGFPAVMEGAQVLTKDRMVRLWTNFAIYGDPTPEEDKAVWSTELGIPKWEPLEPEHHNYLLIQDACTLEVEFPDRWHIAREEAEPTTTTAPPTTPRMCEDYEGMKKERDSYMISMIVFVVAAVCLAALSAYFYFKLR